MGCSVPLYHVGKEHNLFREAYLSASCSPVSNFRPWTEAFNLSELQFPYLLNDDGNTQLIRLL